MAKVVKKSPQKKKTARKTKPDGTWQSIQQNNGLKSTSSASRSRRWKRTFRWLGAGIAAVIAIGAISYGLYFSGKQLPLDTPSHAVGTIERIEFVSDGVLDARWFQSHFPIELGVRTMGYDLQKLKAQIETHGQVKTASVSVSLPDTLIIRLDERKPLLRARVRTPGNQIINILIAGDGTVFDGYNYPTETIAALPGLAGIRFQWWDGQIQEVEEMKQLAPLLETARNEFPALYGDWKWVSVSNLNTDPGAVHSVIEIKSRTSDRIVFAPNQFQGQLRKLNEVVAVNNSQRLGGFYKIDLSFPGQAIVQVRKS
jgi:cell division septal protein FtsQ|tara:strand:+ start:65815 stop:66753 length:939 start_codon:yes stop_codon:yes gene_type:complete